MAASNFLGAVAVAQESGYLVRRYLAEDVTKDLDSLLDGILRSLSAQRRPATTTHALAVVRGSRP